MSYSRGKKIKFNKNEKLTIDWVIDSLRFGKRILTTEVISTLGINGLNKVVKYLNQLGVTSDIDYKLGVVVFEKL